MAFFKDFMARFSDWHEANKRGQRRRAEWGVNRGRVYEGRPEPEKPQRGAVAAVEAKVQLMVTKKNGDRIYLARSVTG